MYKLTYNGERTIKYTSSATHTVAALSSQPVYLYVVEYRGDSAQTTTMTWWYFGPKAYYDVWSASQTGDIKLVRYSGWSLRNGGNGGLYNPKIIDLVQSAVSDTNTADKLFLSTTNYGLGKWSDSNLGAGFVKTNSSGVVSIDTNTYATTSTVNGKAPTSHASTATTYGVGTTSNYGHVKTQTGDLNGTTSTDGVAAGLGHTHSQYLTSHQSIKSLNTNNSTAQTASSSEAIAGSGTINLHKVSKTGSYSDLLNQPTIPATNVIPATTTANKVLVSTTTSGTAKWSDFSSSGFLKTNSSGVVSIDTNTYKTTGVTQNETAKRYLLGSGSAISMATTSTNSSCYMQSGELYSNSKVVGNRLYEYNFIKFGGTYSATIAGGSRTVEIYASFTANVSSITLSSSKYLTIQLSEELTTIPRIIAVGDSSIKISNARIFVRYLTSTYDYNLRQCNFFSQWTDDDESYTDYYVVFSDIITGTTYRDIKIHLGTSGYVDGQMSGTISGTAIN